MHNNSSDVDSKSIKFQYYEPSVYDEFVREDEATGKQNNFVRMGVKTELIYNPSRDEFGRANDAPAKTATAKAADTDTSKDKAKPTAKAPAKAVKAADGATGAAGNTNDTDTSKDKA